MASKERQLRGLLVQDALTTWGPPTVGALLLAAAGILDALGAISDRVAAFLAVIALLMLGAFAALAPRVRNDRHPPLAPSAMLGIGLAWIAVFTVPFALRLFPGAPIASTTIEPDHKTPDLAIGNGRFEVVLDAHMPLASERQDRHLHYDLTFVDGAGHPLHYDGELGDRWQTRRLGRRGTAPVHLEHLSTAHPLDHPAGGTVRLDAATITGVPNATLNASIYRNRIPDAVWLVIGGAAVALAALAFDLWWDPHRTPTAALLTASATGAMLVFCSSAAGHPGLRQVIGSTIVGGVGGVPTAGAAAWLARQSTWTRAITSRRA
jgi:hypothetical protein